LPKMFKIFESKLKWHIVLDEIKQIYTLFININ